MSFLASRVIKFFFPPQCLHCQQEGSWLCLEAKTQLERIPTVLDPLPIDGVSQVLCRGEYDHPLLRTIVQRLKYDYWTGVTEIFPILVAPMITTLLSDQVATWIVPVPLHWRRRLQRGFNQSEYLAKSLSQRTGYPVIMALRRQRSTAPQAKLQAQERLTNITGAFAQGHQTTIPQQVILVDDVITTGSTIKECAAVLRGAGAQHIIAMSLAKG